ncbi:MAG: SBBP repeat-containing protein [Bacteroidota bacterium]
MKHAVKIGLAALLLFSIASSAQTPDWLWARNGGGTDSEAFGRTIAADANGNIYVTGNFGGSGATFGTLALTSTGGNDIFIVKYDRNGNVVWAKSVGGSGNDTGNGIVIDSDGNVYVTGLFSSNGITFDTVQLTSAGGNDIFIAKFNTNGDVLWAKGAGGTGADVSYSIVVDNSNNAYITGYFSNTATFGSIELTSAGSSDVFVVKYDTNGNIVWAKRAGGSSGDTANCITINASSIYLTGFFMGNTSIFGEDTLSSVGNSDVFIVKYNTNGDAIWAKSAGGSGGEIGYYINTDADGNLYIVGNLGSGGATFSSVQLTSAGGNDIFVAKYNASGDVIWAKSAGGTGNDYGYNVAVKNKNIYVSGYFNDVATFGSFQLTTNGGNDVFISKYDENGNVILARSVGGTGTDDGWGIALDDKENIYVGGRFGSSSISFGSYTLTNSNSATTGTSYDVFVAKFGLIVSVERNEEVPSVFQLLQNYPNPFNPSTTISFTVVKREFATLKVYNILGQEIATLFNGIAEPGKNYKLNFYADNLSSGIFMVQLISGGNVQMKKIILMK